MLEQAVVEEVLENRKSGELVLLKKIRPDACHHCNGKIICGINQEFFFKAENPSSEKLKKGDMVEYRLPNVSIIRLSFLLYSVPLGVFLLTLLGFILFFPDQEYLSLSLALLSMLITFLLVGLYDKRKFNIGNRNLPQIEQIVKER